MFLIFAKNLNGSLYAFVGILEYYVSYSISYISPLLPYIYVSDSLSFVLLMLPAGPTNVLFCYSLPTKPISILTPLLCTRSDCGIRCRLTSEFASLFLFLNTRSNNFIYHQPNDHGSILFAYTSVTVLLIIFAMCMCYNSHVVFVILAVLHTLITFNYYSHNPLAGLLEEIS